VKIGIDIDDTIVNTRVIEEQFKAKYNYNADEETWYEFCQKHVQEICELATIKPGVKEAFDWMRNNGCEIVIITARERFDHFCNERFTARLFEENGIPYDKLIIESMPKGPDAHQHGIDLFFDDLESNLDNVSSYGIESIKVCEELTCQGKYKEFTNWYDILAYIKLRKNMRA